MCIAILITPSCKILICMPYSQSYAQGSPAGRGRGASGPVASGIGEFLSGGSWDGWLWIFVS